ncbi:MAG: adenylosuccinate synthetase, partial [Candidatus Binatia bacterium]
EFPSSLRVLKRAEPVWEEMGGWDTSLSGARKLSDLPINAQRYVRHLEEILETRMVLVSVGPGREQTIMINDLFCP